MYARRNDNTSHYEIIIDIDEITEAAQSEAGLSKLFKDLVEFYLKITETIYPFLKPNKEK